MMKYSQLIKKTSIFGFVIAAILVVIMYSDGFFEEVTAGLSSEIVAALEFWVGIGLTFTFIFNLCFLPVHISKALSLIKGRINKNYDDSETYIYTRELPKYNAVVAGALYDLKATFEEDYIAGVLDLIIKGYILEKDNHLVVDTNKTREGLLKNEIYILDSCEKTYLNLDSLINIDFYKVLKADMYDLGFYKEQIWLEKINEKFQYWMIKNSDKKKKITYIACVFSFLMLIWGISENVKLALLVMLILYIAATILLRKNKLTQLGEAEKERMTKLRHFLENETSFDEKKLDEKKLWDRYPAFAVAFGVNKEMSKRIIEKLNRKN